ncbi:hypothetical protein CDV31_014575 [Fusarium ambrosium]|uniref:Uncharacterized protein n=1 Tax=Fusarium ambrosium TaxID=131363 RepID=A0A428SVD5_9HYPO|nr:hypothetical protein CDV31_014575 [Fusarium ambrosium]
MLSQKCKCQFDKPNHREVHISVLAELSCHERAQRGLDRLQQGPNTSLEKQLDDFPIEPLDAAPEFPTERPRKRPRCNGPQQGRLPTPTDSRQDNPRENNEEKATRGSEQDESDVQTLTLKAMEGLAKLRVTDKDTGLPGELDFVAKLPVQFNNDCIRVEEYMGQHCAQDSTSIWESACRHRNRAKDINWLLCLVSTCLNMIETSMCKTVPSLGSNEERRRSRWAKGISILNRIIDQVGFAGLRLYDAYGVKHFYFSEYAGKAGADRKRIADSVAKAILEKGMSGPANSRVLYIPYLVRVLFDARFGERISQGEVCKILSLESFANFQISSPFVSLQELYTEMMRIQSPRSNITTKRLFDGGAWRIYVARDSTPATTSLDRLNPEASGPQCYNTLNEASGRSQEPQTPHSAMKPRDEVNTGREDMTSGTADQRSTQGLLPDQPRCQSVPSSTTRSHATRASQLGLASASPPLAALNNRIERTAPQELTALNISRHQTSALADVGSTMAQGLSPQPSHSCSPSCHPTEVPSQPQPSPKTQITPNLPAVQSHVTWALPLYRTPESREEVPMQEPSASAQHGRSEVECSAHQPTLSPPVAREQTTTVSNHIGPGREQESSAQDLSHIHPSCHQPPRDVAALPNHQQHDNPSSHPLTTQTGPEPTDTQSCVVTPAHESSHDSPYILGSEAGMSVIRSSQPEHVGRNPSMTIDSVLSPVTEAQQHQMQPCDQTPSSPFNNLPSNNHQEQPSVNDHGQSSMGESSRGIEAPGRDTIQSSGHEVINKTVSPPHRVQVSSSSLESPTSGIGGSIMQGFMREITGNDTVHQEKAWDMSDAFSEWDKAWDMSDMSGAAFLEWDKARGFSDTFF